MSKSTKRRENSFFGLHFDFHAKPSDENIIPIGKTVTEESIQHIIDTTNPDFIQIDCKGHPGWSSYPTKAGNPYPIIEKDTLKLWRDVTAKNNVALYMHYSGVCDDFQCEIHPEWRRIGLVGDSSFEWLPKGITSTFSSYVDDIVIPQLLELAGEYGVDGVWVDGECWGTQIDYSPNVMKLFKEETGIDVSDNPPLKPGADHWQQYADFCREQFRNYLRKYTDAVHKKYPDFQIASNWAFSSKMPEKVCVDVDFLSGDYLWADSLNSARYEGRCLASQGMPWDLMAWGFRWRHGDKMERCPKHPEQLKQEAAAVIAMGGGFQSYYPQKKDGGIHKWQIDLMGEVAKFCREREELCHKAKFIPQIAVINSTYDRYHRSNHLFQCEGEDGALQGIVQLLCEAGHSFEVLSEHAIENRLDEYPVVILPETHQLEQRFLSKLINYSFNGGSLLVVGTKAFDLVGSAMNMTGTLCSGEFLISDDNKTWAYNQSSVVKTNEKGVVGGKMTELASIDLGEGHSVWEIIEHGKGKIGFIKTDIGEIYLTRKSHVHRNMIKNILNRLYKPIVSISNTMYIDMTLMTKNNAVSINLVNTTGSHGDQDIFTMDEIPTTGPFNITIRCSSKPKKVMLMPENKPLNYTWDETAQTISAVIEKVHIHSIVTMEN